MKSPSVAGCLVAFAVLAQYGHEPLISQPNELSVTQDAQARSISNLSWAQQGPLFVPRATRRANKANGQPAGLNFAPAVAYNSGGIDADSIAVADVNGDGKPDLVVVDACAVYGSCTPLVGVLLGNGDGTFQPVVTYSSNDGAAGEAFSVAVADVNGDGKPDLIVANSDVLGVLLGNGDGTFQPAVTYGSGGAHSVAATDVNGDGKPDLVVVIPCSNGSTCGDGLVGVLLGNGDGTFQTAATYGSGGNQTFCAGSGGCEW